MFKATTNQPLLLVCQILRKNQSIQNQCRLYFKDQKSYTFLWSGNTTKCTLHIVSSKISSSSHLILFHDPIIFLRRNTLSKGRFLTHRFCLCSTCNICPILLVLTVRRYSLFCTGEFVLHINAVLYYVYTQLLINVSSYFFTRNLTAGKS